MRDKEVMLGVPDEETQMIELMDHRAMVELPEDSVEAEIRCKVYHDGELVNITRKLQMSDLREAFRKADEGYIDDDDRFVLTDKGKAYLEEIDRSI